MPLKRSVAAPPDAPPTVEQVRQQAKRRLIGVSVLVLAAVVVFPLIFDTQPRPVAVDMPIEIPSRKTAKPLQVDTPAVEPAPAPAPAEAPPVGAAPASAAAPGAAAASGATAAGASSAREPQEEIIPTAPRAASPAAAPAAGAGTDSTAKAPPPPQAKPASSAEPKPEPKPPARAAEASSVTKPEPKPATKPEPKPATKSAAPAPTAPAAQADAQTARALALLEGREAAPPPPAGAAPAAAPRYIVQVGAFAETEAAQAARLKLERAGLKTYTHVAQLPEGKRTRVRLGPFATRAEAEQAAAKAKAQGFPAAILTL